MSFFQPDRDIYLLGPEVYLPERVLSNQELLDWMGVDEEPEWIRNRTGIEERRWARDDQACSDIAAAAAEKLMRRYEIDPGRIAQLLLATISGDFPTPPTSPLTLQLLGLKNVGALDLGAACSGFVSGLHVAAGLFFATGREHLVIAADIRSKFLSRDDLATTPLFGDGAASCLVTGQPGQARFRLVASELGADPSVADIISIRAGGSRLPQTRCEREEDRYLHMRQGAKLFFKGVSLMANSARGFLDRLDMTIDDIDWVVPHQANLRLIRAMAKKLGVPGDKVVETVQFTGNAAGACVGIALGHLMERLPLQPGQKLLLVAAGAGGSSATALLESR